MPGCRVGHQTSTGQGISRRGQTPAACRSHDPRYRESLEGDRNRMNHVELNWSRPRTTPLPDLPARGVVLDDAGIAVAIRYKDTAGRGKAMSVAPQNSHRGAGTSPTLIWRSFWP